MSKIFGIGFHKTGTSSLAEALRTLDYKVCDGAHPFNERGTWTQMIAGIHKGNLDLVYQVADDFEAFQDNPWYLLYSELDKQYPGSKFILTLRDEENWLRSALNHFSNKGFKRNDMKKLIYGNRYGRDKKLLLDRYRRHNKEVLAYFKDRPNDLVILNWEEGDGWKELCEWLNKPMPTEDFPHSNRSDFPKGWRAVKEDIWNFFS